MFNVGNYVHLTINLLQTNLSTNRLILMWFLMGKFEDEPITNIAKAAVTKRWFITAFLLPDNWDIPDAHNAMEMEHNEHINLMFLEEDF